MKTFVMGDIHGAYKALVQCLERSGFNKAEDRLIQLGDVADGWGQTYECVEELITIPNLIPIKGNHDEAFREWIEVGMHGFQWKQGAFATLKSYGTNCLGSGWEDFQVRWKSSGSAVTNLVPENLPPTHIKFFSEQLPYYILDNKCFVHGGFNRHMEFEGQYPKDIYWWDRDLWASALSFDSMSNPLNESGYTFKMKTPFDEVFIGHTATVNWMETKEYHDEGGRVTFSKKVPIDTPMHAANVWNLDTGGGFMGKVTIMDVDTKEYWQSDLVEKLYPNETRRR
jgi:serine/threonine protein phosphatase 1